MGIAACVLSAPGNEFRGYCLQDPKKRLSFLDFFQPSKFIRSTSVGGLIMATSLGIGTLATPQVQKLWATIRAFFKQNQLGYLFLIFFLCNYVIQERRHQQLAKAGERRHQKVVKAMEDMKSSWTLL